MSSFVKASGGITPNSADPGEEFPFLHTISVVDRVVSVDKAELVQNNIKTETVTLNLDSEWEGLSTVINIGNERPVSVIWSGEPVVIPAELMTTVGSLDVSVVGYGDDGGIRAVTKQAKSIFNVVASGFVEGNEPVPDPTTILGQLVQAADNANQAADRFNQASEDIGVISSAVEKAQASETNTKHSETNAAASAESALQSASTASASAEAARTSETNAAASAATASEASTAAKASETNAASSASAASQSASQAQSSATAAASSAQAASTSAESAKTASDSATSSKDAAAQSASDASASASAAKASETSAASSASAAKISETNAAASATAAQQAVDGFDLTVGSVTTGEPGTDATVDITKDGAKYTANFTIPRGEKGEQGGGGTENVLIGTASGTIAAADDSYSAPRQIRVHGETIENFWKYKDGKKDDVNISIDDSGLITFSSDTTGLNRYAVFFDFPDEYLEPGKYTIYNWSNDSNIMVGIASGFAGDSQITGTSKCNANSSSTFEVISGRGYRFSVNLESRTVGEAFTSYVRVMIVKGENVLDKFTPSGITTAKPEKLVVQIVLASGTDIPSDFPKNESSEVALPSDLNLADGDTLVIDSDGSTQITHSSGEPTPSTPVTLPAIPAPTFAIYTKGGLTRPTVDVDYERNINIVINKLEQAIAVQAATMKVNQLTD